MGMGTSRNRGAAGSEESGSFEHRAADHPAHQNGLLGSNTSRWNATLAIQSSLIVITHWTDTIGDAKMLSILDSPSHGGHGAQGPSRDLNLPKAHHWTAMLGMIFHMLAPQPLYKPSTPSLLTIPFKAP